MPAPICAKCNQEMRCVKNRQLVHDPKVGDFSETFWIGDKYECPICKSEIVTGFAEKKFLREEIEKITTSQDREAAIPFVYDPSQHLEQYKK